MWSDNETHLDLLSFQYLVSAIIEIIDDPDLLPTTIGVHGDWGSGKSSLLKMVHENLKTRNDVLCISFNGWLFEGYDNAKTALIETILEDIQQKRGLSGEAEGLLKRLTSRINWMRLIWTGGKYASAYALQGKTGLGLSAVSDFSSLAKTITEKYRDSDPEDLEKFLKDEFSLGKEPQHAVRKFRSDFGELLKAANVTKLVVFIDDLDRCMPDTIIETLEAIKLFLFVENTVFIIGADEDLVKYAVRQRFPQLPGEHAEVGRDYLEKLIQFPIRIPPLGPAELEGYINLLFAMQCGLEESRFEQIRERAVVVNSNGLNEVCFDYRVAQEVLGDIPPNLEEGLVLAQFLAPSLTIGLSGNPRQTKRFLNTLMLRIGMAQSRGVSLQIRVLAKLMLLEYLRSQSFRSLAQLQQEHAGYPPELKYLEQTVRQKQSLQVSPEPEEATEKTSLSEPFSGNDFVTTWLADQWLETWLLLEPTLHTVDLRPYFFFSRDNKSYLVSSSARLNPRAQDVLNLVLSESEAVRNNGLNKASELSDADAMAVLEFLAEQVKHQEDETIRNQHLKTLFLWTEKRRGLSSQLITFLENVQDSILPPVAVIHLQRLFNDSEMEEVAKRLVSKWSNSANKPLANLAKTRLQRWK